jgi:hypothetical protein
LATVALAILIPLVYATSASSASAIGWALLVYFGALMLVAARLAWAGGCGEPWTLSSSAAFASSSSSVNSAASSDAGSASAKAIVVAAATAGPLFVARARARFDCAGAATLVVACVQCAQARLSPETSRSIGHQT